MHDTYSADLEKGCEGKKKKNKKHFNSFFPPLIKAICHLTSDQSGFKCQFSVILLQLEKEAYEKNTDLSVFFPPYLQRMEI